MTATDPIDEARLGLLLGELRLPGIKHIWSRFAERADKEGWPAARFLAALAEHELAERARRRIERHLTEARLPLGKTLDSFDFDAVPMVSKAQVMALVAATAGSRRATTCSCSDRPAAERAISPPPSASGSSRMAGVGCSPAQPTSSSAYRSRGANSRWNPPSPGSTSIIC